MRGVCHARKELDDTLGLSAITRLADSLRRSVLLTNSTISRPIAGSAPTIFVELGSFLRRFVGVRPKK
jgi:hypothetical protein